MAADAWLISITDDNDLYLAVFTDPAWAEWLRSLDPPIEPGHTSVRLSAETMPATLVHPVLINVVGGGFPVLTSGTYADDKMHLVAGAATPIEPNDLSQYNIVDTFATIAY